MRKILGICFCIIFIFSLAISAAADTAAPSVTVYATVGNDGGCEVSIHVSLRLEQADKDLSFPVPANAKAVRLNGTRMNTRTQGDVQHIDLAGALGGMAGEINFTVSYELSNVVSKSEAGTPQVEIPLLSGFAYPIEMMEFSVTIPGQITAKPAFTSGYHQASIEQSLSAETSGNTVTGYSLKNLKDHETLTMTLPVDAGIFPEPAVPLDAALFDDVGMLVCAVLALIYWLLALRCKPMSGEKTDLPPAGFNAGELGSILTMQGADLSMMVFHWAQLGYILIQLDRNKRVFLHKRMEMGNERSGFEQRCFNNLFAGKKMVDTSGYRYAMLCKKMQVFSPNVRPLISRKSGNPRVFRLLCAGIGLFGGMSVGFALVSSVVLQWFLAIIFAALGAMSAWHIQKWADCLLLSHKQKMKNALLLSIPWVLLGMLGGITWLTVAVVLSQFLAGLMAAYGGRRTEEGRQAIKQVLGLRRYLKSMDKKELQRIVEADPDYFHDLAPYALALGVDKAFAKAFGRSGISSCAYLTTGMDGHRSAMEWSNLMTTALEAMNRRLNQMPMERFQKILASFRR